MQSPVSHCVRGLSEEASGLRSRRPWSLGCVPRLSLELLVVPRMREKKIAGETKVEQENTNDAGEVGMQDQGRTC